MFSVRVEGLTRALGASGVADIERNIAQIARRIEEQRIFDQQDDTSTRRRSTTASTRPPRTRG